MKDLLNKIHNADCLTFLRAMPDECVDCVVTSPPYWGLRDYGVDGQIGLEPTIELYISHLVEIFGECKRVLKKTGTMWINIGDSYAGSSMTGGLGSGKEIADRMFNKPTVDSNLPSKSLCQIPERLSIALTDQLGLIKRNTIIWYKRNCMPSSASDRFTVDFEYLYFFTKHQDYWFEQQFEDNSIGTVERARYAWNTKKHIDKREQHNEKGMDTRAMSGEFRLDGRNKRTVWDIPTEPTPDAHFAVFPRALVHTPIRAGCPGQICNKCGKSREKIYAEKEGMKYDEIGNPQGINRSKMSWNNSHPTKNPRFWSNPNVVGSTDCGCNAGFHPGTVLDPFAGSGTTCLEAKEQGKHYIGIELNPEYIKIADKKLRQEVLPFNRVIGGNL